MAAPEPQVGTPNNFAQRMGVTERTVQRWISKRMFPVYRVPGLSGLFIKMDEAEAAVLAQPANKVRLGYGSYGDADIRTLDIS